jgi:hypothetical protein
LVTIFSIGIHAEKTALLAARSKWSWLVPHKTLLNFEQADEKTESAKYLAVSSHFAAFRKSFEEKHQGRGSGYHVFPVVHIEISQALAATFEGCDLRQACSRVERFLDLRMKAVLDATVFICPSHEMYDKTEKAHFKMLDGKDPLYVAIGGAYHGVRSYFGSSCKIQEFMVEPSGQVYSSPVHYKRGDVNVLHWTAKPACIVM